VLLVVKHRSANVFDQWSVARFGYSVYVEVVDFAAIILK